MPLRSPIESTSSGERSHQKTKKGCGAAPTYLITFAIEQTLQNNKKVRFEHTSVQLWKSRLTSELISANSEGMQLLGMMR